MSVNGAWRILGLASSKITGIRCHIYPQSNNRAPFWGKMPATPSWRCFKICVNGASTIFDLASWKIQGQWYVADPQSTYRQLLLAKMQVMILRPPPTIERPRSINNSCGGLASYTAMNCIPVLLNQVLRAQSSQCVLLYNFANMHAMSHRSDFFECSSRVNI